MRRALGASFIACVAACAGTTVPTIEARPRTDERADASIAPPPSSAFGGDDAAAPVAEGGAVSATSSLPACARRTLDDGYFRFASATVHDRGRLVASAFDATALVLGPGARVSAGEIVATTAPLAFAATWPTQRLHGVWVLDTRSAPDAGARATPPALGIPDGREVDLDFDRASTTNVASLLSEITRITSKNAPEGSVSILAHRARSGALLHLLADLSGDARMTNGTLTFGAAASFGAAAPSSTACARHGIVRLACVKAADVRVVGVAKAPGHKAVALVRHAPDGIGELIREGAFIGVEQLRIDGIECEGLRTETGDLMRLDAGF